MPTPEDVKLIHQADQAVASARNFGGAVGAFVTQTRGTLIESGVDAETAGAQALELGKEYVRVFVYSILAPPQEQPPT